VSGLLGTRASVRADAVVPARAGEARLRVRRAVAAGAVYLVLLMLAALFLLPLYWMVATAVRPQQLVYRFPPDWLAGDLTLSNFRVAWSALPFGRFFLNTAFVTFLTAFGIVLSSSLAGFGFARYRARGSSALFVVLLATMMVPASTTLVPRFVMFSKIGWTDSYLPLVVPPFFAGAFHVFLFRQFFRAVPREYFDAAEIDGCAPLGLWWRVALPMARPAIAASAMFSSLTAWNDFIDPLVFLSSLDKLTLQIGLSTFQGQYFQQLHLMMPMALLGVLPVLALVVVGQRWIAHGLTYDAEK
jgi:ABC-type glycerol-3-phosphate transport system permease component